METKYKQKTELKESANYTTLLEELNSLEENLSMEVTK